MNYIFDLDDTLIQSTSLNNDAYNYALEKFGYSRIETKERITREIINFLPPATLRNVIQEKQKYFTSEWLPYRIVVNSYLLNIIKKCGREICYLWTKASKKRVVPILSCYNLNKSFNQVIFDNKVNFYDSIQKLMAVTKSKELTIYENNHKFFKNKSAEIIKYIKDEKFDVAAYLIVV